MCSSSFVFDIEFIFNMHRDQKRVEITEKRINISL